QPLTLTPSPAPAGAAAWRSPLRAGVAGSFWAAWPCGLLHSALVVAALAPSAAGGAAVMSGFALASAPGLAAAPWLWRRLGQAGDKVQRLATRLAGGLLVAAALWALLGHGAWDRVAAFCGF
ncbi:MAG: sulfite exporter TauE/SafE family protein, partial [Rubrivivax sp.]|nr:sulfite exporter TauE/SafE family protein [Rubrivivax sp.]